MNYTALPDYELKQLNERIQLLKLKAKGKETKKVSKIESPLK